MIGQTYRLLFCLTGSQNSMTKNQRERRSDDTLLHKDKSLAQVERKRESIDGCVTDWLQ